MMSATIVRDAPTKRRPNRPLLAVGAIGVVLAGVLLARFALSLFSPHLYAGTVFQLATPAPSMDSLTLDSGESADLSQFSGQVVLVYFGYTHCPDVCPTTLSDVSKALATLGSDADRVALVMVTIDPERDDLEATGEYVQFFDERFHAASGTLPAITDVATRYGVYFKAGEVDATGAYDMEHTGSLMGIDPEGNLRIVWAPGVDAEALAGDLSELLS